MGKRRHLSIFIIDEEGHRRTIFLKGWQIGFAKFMLSLLILMFMVGVVYAILAAATTRRVMQLEMENRKLKQQLMVLDSIRKEVEEFRRFKEQLYGMLGVEESATINEEYSPISGTFMEDLVEQIDTPYGLPVSGVLTRFHGNGHIGVDLALKTGSPVFATARGVVTTVDSNAQFGLHVWISHAKGYRTLYAHLSRVIVSKGDSVRRGQVVGYSGSSGESTGPHVHYEVWKGNVALNPLKFVE